MTKTRIGKKTPTILIVVLSLVTTFFLSQARSYTDSDFLVNMALILRVLIHFSLFLAWIFSVQERIMQRKVKTYLILIGGLIVFWLLARTIKYYFLADDSSMALIMWYSYYLPMLSIPILSIFTGLSLGKPADYNLPRKMHLLSIPTFVMIILVLTNNLHQQVFVFTSQPWSDDHYGYGLGYWIVYAWMIASLVAGIALILAKSRVPRSKKILWLPFVPMLALVGQGIANMMRIPIIANLSNDITLFFSLMIVLTLESCIQIGLIKSNKSYEELFFSSGIPAWIVDRHEEVRYFTEDAYGKPIRGDNNSRLSKAKINGGQVWWLEDISTMNQLLSELKDVGDQLSERNDLLRAEIELKERQAQLDEKTRLYDRLRNDVSHQLQILDDLLVKDHGPETLIRLCVLGAYIKRRSNLTILGEENPLLSAKELEYCFRETKDALSAGGIDCYFKGQCEGMIGVESALVVYDAFEEIIEMTLPSLTALFINLKVIDERVELKLQLSGDIEKIQEAISVNRAKSLGTSTIKAEKTIEDDTFHLTLELTKENVSQSKGGGNL